MFQEELLQLVTILLLLNPIISLNLFSTINKIIYMKHFYSSVHKGNGQFWSLLKSNRQFSSNKIFFILLIIFLSVFSVQFTQAQNTQSEYLVRSTTGVSGSSVTSSQNNKTYIVQQSIGQASVIGTFNNPEYTIRQGFIQPNVLAKIINKHISLDLEASFYPNPFVESVTLAFTETIKGKVEVVVFDMLGRLVFSNSYTAAQNLKVQFDNLSVADYILKVTANNKQFVKNIVKK